MYGTAVASSQNDISTGFRGKYLRTAATFTDTIRHHDISTGFRGKYHKTAVIFTDIIRRMRRNIPKIQSKKKCFTPCYIDFFLQMQDGCS